LSSLLRHAELLRPRRGRPRLRDRLPCAGRL